MPRRDGCFQGNFVDVLFCIDHVLLSFEIDFGFGTVVLPGENLGTARGFKGGVLDEHLVQVKPGFCGCVCSFVHRCFRQGHRSSGRFSFSQAASPPLRV